MNVWAVYTLFSIKPVYDQIVLQHIHYKQMVEKFLFLILYSYINAYDINNIVQIVISKGVSRDYHIT